MIKILKRNKHKVKFALYVELNTTLPPEDFTRNLNTFVERIKQTGLINHFIPLWIEYDEKIIYGEEDGNLQNE